MNNIGIGQALATWYRRNFSNPEAVSLFLTLVFGLLFFELFGSFFMPVIVSVILAYLLLRPVRLLKKCRIPDGLAVALVFMAFLGFVALILFVLMPLIWRQLANFVSALPSFFITTKHWLKQFVAHYPNILSASQVQRFITVMQGHVTSIAQYILSYSIQFIPNVIQIVLYVILVPLLLFFFLKDADVIVQWFDPYLPKNRTLLFKVANEMNGKIGAYIRGRVLEVIILGLTTYIAFISLGLHYPVLLSFIVGLSCIIPYVGAILVTIPVVIVALMQWGVASPSFVYLILVYAIILTVDANILVPLLFSEALSLHPVVIILAVIIFGGIWGFWGVFFSIPLASLLWAVLQAWPKHMGEPIPLPQGDTEGATISGNVDETGETR